MPWPERTAVRRTLLAVGLGAAGGLAFQWLDVPLAWMLGAMLATTVASLSGLDIAIPAAWRSPTIAVLGLVLGSSFTADVAARMLAWLPSLAVLPIYIVVIGVISILYLRRVGRIDARTAFFCATPGGLGEMILLGDRLGGDVRTISLVHATRVLLIVFMVPLGFQAFGHVPSGLVLGAAATGAGWADLLVLALCGGLGLWLGVLARLPAPGLLGPMMLSAAAHLLGWVEGAPPWFLVAAAQAVIGSSVGCRFRGYPLARVVWMVLTGFGLTAIMLTVTLLIGFGLHRLTAMPVELVFLAFVPGGLAEMSLIALALTEDPAFVAAVHIVRIGLVVLLAAPLYALYRRLAKLSPG